MIKHARRYLLAGVLTVIPILVTVVVFSFFLGTLSDIGKPKVLLVANAVRPWSPELASALIEELWLQSVLAIILTLGMFYLLGWAMSKMVGRRVLNLVERWLNRIPLVTTVYGATKQMIETFRNDHGDIQRVVLIEFPREGMHAVGFVTRMMADAADGRELASVYVPTAPNPTGGYLVIVPTASLISLDWTVDQAMTFVVSGGSTAPGAISVCRTVPARKAATPEGSGPAPDRAAGG
jgi:uncharacterized membrane protein